MNESPNISTPPQPPLVIPDVSRCPLSVVYLEDCVEGLKRFNDKHFDLAIVDPPYGFRTEKTGILNFRKGKQEKEWNVAPHCRIL